MFCLFEVLIVEVFESAIWNKDFRNSYSFWSLIVLHDCSYDSRQCECRTVECVAEFCLLV